MKISITDKPDETVQLCIDCTYSELSDIQRLLDTGYECQKYRDMHQGIDALANAINEHFNKEE